MHVETLDPEHHDVSVLYSLELQGTHTTTLQRGDFKE
jgi:hypothetical protein